MSTAVARVDQTQTLPAMITPQALVARLQAIEAAMSSTMQVNVDFGTIPGTPKPTLYKSGAEKLCTLFNIAVDYSAEDVDTDDCITIRVKCVATHQTTGVVLGSGLGDASSNEAKWKWRKAICQEEWEETPVDRRRAKWCRGKNNSTYKELQVRTEPDDLRNTVLQMAKKRALVAMVRVVTNASSIFLQDLDDMPEELREQIVEAHNESRGGGQRPQQQNGNTTQRQQPQARADAPSTATDAQVKIILKKLDDAGMAADVLCKKFGVDAVAKLPFDKVNEALEFIRDPEREAIQAQEAGK